MDKDKLPVRSESRDVEGATEDRRPLRISPAAADVFPTPTGDYAVDHALYHHAVETVQELARARRDPIEEPIAAHGREWWAAILFHRCDGRVLVEVWSEEGKAEQSASRFQADYLHGMDSGKFNRTSTCRAEIFVAPAYLDGYSNYQEWARTRKPPCLHPEDEHGK